MTKKYELITTDTMTDDFGRTCYRIRALLTFANVLAGALGGYVHTEDHLAQVSGNILTFYR
jgi:hypothetical protein